MGQERSGLAEEREVLGQELQEQRRAHERLESVLADREQRLTAAEDALRASETQSEQIRAELESRTSGLREEAESARSRFEAALAEERTERSVKDDELQRLRASLEERDHRLEDVTTKVATLSAEKRALEDRLSHEEGERRVRVAELDARLEERRVEMERTQRELSEAQAQLTAVQEGSEEVESRYLKELEDVHENYLERAQEIDETHSRELEILRSQLIEAKRSLRTSQLEAQRLGERLQKVESGRAPRSTARAEFESFIARAQDRSATVPPVAPESGPARAPSSSRRAPVSSPEVKPAAPEEAGPAEDSGVAQEIDDFLRSQFDGYES
ncbi:MAG: hypothetical protein AAFU79_31355 [Myxococcota bacterium]